MWASSQIKSLYSYLILFQSIQHPRRRKPRFAKKTFFLVLLYCWETWKSFLGSKNRCFFFQGIGTPVRESDVRGRLSGSSLTSRLDITAIKLWKERQSWWKGFYGFCLNKTFHIRRESPEGLVPLTLLSACTNLRQTLRCCCRHRRQGFRFRFGFRYHR